MGGGGRGCWIDTPFKELITIQGIGSQKNCLIITHLFRVWFAWGTCNPKIDSPPFLFFYKNSEAFAHAKRRRAHN